MSEAIRKAIPLNIRQGIGEYFYKNTQGSFCACAAGQALIGAGILTLEQAEKLADIPRHEMRDKILAFLPIEWTSRAIENRYRSGIHVATGLNDKGTSLEGVAKVLEKLGQ